MRRTFVIVVGFLTACGPPSIEKLCEEASQSQCAVCFSCDIDGAAACNLEAGADVDTCERELSDRCVDQAATLERPKREIEDCNDSFDQLTCDLLVRGAAQDAPHTTDACVYFL